MTAPQRGDGIRPPEGFLEWLEANNLPFPPITAETVGRLDKVDEDCFRMNGVWKAIKRPITPD